MYKEYIYAGCCHASQEWWSIRFGKVVTPRNSKLSSRVYGRFTESRRCEKGESKGESKREREREREREKRRGEGEREREGTTQGRKRGEADVGTREENELDRVYRRLRVRYYDVQARARCSFLRAHPHEFLLPPLPSFFFFVIFSSTSTSSSF